MIRIFMFGIMSVHPASTAGNRTLSYIIGGIVAFLILIYLVYTLIRPDKF